MAPVIASANPAQVIERCDRKVDIGAEGVTFVLLGGEGGDYTLRIFTFDSLELVY
ncbi:hypothetical protein U2F10_23985 [Leptothoe sp. EHU-05/26/07-4]